MAANAENAGETVYENAVPGLENEPPPGSHPAHHKTPNTGESETGRATGSNAETGGVGPNDGESGTGSGDQGSSKEGSSQEGEGNPPTGGGAGGGNPGGGAGGQPEGSVGEGQKVGGGTSTPTHTSESSGGGGSSPVVPILIAVVILAAISIGVVLYRQRKSGQDGPDGRISSPNAG